MKKSIITTLCFGLLAIAVTAQAKNYNSANGHGYEVVVVPNGITWLQARDAAVAAGGYLATITSADENKFVYDLAAANNACWHIESGWCNGPWLGGFQLPGSNEPDGGWCWVTGEAWSYTNWSIGNPSNAAGIEDVLHFGGYQWVPNTSEWNDIYGPSRVNAYIVEYNPVPEPSSILALLSGTSALGSFAAFKKR